MTISWGSDSLRAATRAISRRVSALRRPAPLLASPVRELVQQHEAWVKQCDSPPRNAQQRPEQNGKLLTARANTPGHKRL